MGEKKKSEKTTKNLREFSSGGVVYKKEGQNIFWLVAKSKPSKEYPLDVWRLPKGWVDDKDNGKNPGPTASGDIRSTEEDLQDSAKREVKEEGGVEAKIISKLGTEMYVINSKLRKAKVMKFVTFYLMEWIKDLAEGFGEETSEVSWIGFDEARKKLTYSGEKKMLDKAKTLLDSGIQASLV